MLLEKPIANSPAEADSIIAAAERAGKTLMVAYPHRYKKSFRLFKQIIDSGRYGKLIMLDSLMDDSVEGYLAEWMTRKATLGGGCLFSASGHQLDIMLWISGDVHAAYMVGTRGRVPMEGEDTAACILKFKNGSDRRGAPHLGFTPDPDLVHHGSHVREGASHPDLHAAGRPEYRGCALRLARRELSRCGKQEEVLLESDEGLDLAPEIEHFFECVDTGRRPETDGNDGAQGLRGGAGCIPPRREVDERRNV